MSAFLKIKQTWKQESQRLSSTNALNQFRQSEINKSHFHSLMTELYFLFLETPKIFNTACSNLSEGESLKVQEIVNNSNLCFNIYDDIKSDLILSGLDFQSLSTPLDSSSTLFSKTYYDLKQGRHNLLIVHFSLLGLFTKLVDDCFYKSFKEAGLLEQHLSTLKNISDNKFKPFQLIRRLIDNFELSENDVEDICTSIAEHASIFEEIINDSYERV